MKSYNVQLFIFESEKSLTFINDCILFKKRQYIGLFLHLKAVTFKIKVKKKVNKPGLKCIILFSLMLT